MCFVIDSDWSAEVVHENEGMADGVRKCDECHRVMPQGQKTHHVFQQEWAQCHICYEGDCDCPDKYEPEPEGIHINADELQEATRLSDRAPSRWKENPILNEDHQCVCPEPAYGESFEYEACDECHKFLETVVLAEIKSGCARSEAHPGYTGMLEMIGEGGWGEAAKYFHEAEQVYPELVASGYLQWLKRKMFPRDDNGD